MIYDYKCESQNVTMKWLTKIMLMNNFSNYSTKEIESMIDFPKLALFHYTKRYIIDFSIIFKI